MARVTVEDCVTKVPNRFELVLMAAQRARDISTGGHLTVERDNDKNPVVALREIAEDTVELEHLRNTLVSGLQKHVEVDEPEEDELEAFMPDSDIAFENIAADEDGLEDGMTVTEDPMDFSGDMPDMDE